MPTHNSSMIDDYSLVKKLAKGRFSVYLATRNSKYYVLKVYPCKEGATSCYFQNEFRFFSLNHPNIILICDYKEKATTVTNKTRYYFSYIVMEYAPYGDFFDFLTRKRIRMEDKLARTFFRQFIEGLDYLHSQGIAHLDLKPDNLLIGEDCQLKIADFDLSYMKDDIAIQSKGTRNLRAPEMIHNNCKNPRSADIFSAGILLFIFKTGGKIPQKEEKLHQGVNLYQLLQHDYDQFWQKHCTFLGCPPETFSSEFRDLFYIMTREDPSQRATIEDIKNSRWYNQEVYSPDQLKDIFQKAYTKLM